MYKFWLSRKFWFLVVGVVQTVILHYFKVDPEIWAAIDGLIAFLIMGIAIEDAGEKAGVYISADEVKPE